MLKVIHHNKDKTVGIVSDPANLSHIGAFSPKLLKEWLVLIDEVFGDDIDAIQIKVKKSEQCECFGLFATHDGGNPYVTVTGRYPLDGSKWEEPNAK